MNVTSLTYRMRLFSFSFVCLLLVIASSVSGQQVTTFILVRHAEKIQDGSKDPALTEEGNARAKRLLALLDKTAIDAVYSTPYKRTRATIEPVALAKGLAIREYEAQKEAVIDAMLAAHAGKTILVSGHSNTVPEMANWLIGSKQYETFDDSDYGNLIIVSVVTKGSAKITWLRY